MSLVLGAGVVFVAPQGVASGLFNVKDPTYGAKGDGTTDDTTAIQTAINAAQAVGGTVYLPNGLYKLTAALTVTAGCRIIGEGLTPLYGLAAMKFNANTALLSLWPWTAYALIRMLELLEDGTTTAINHEAVVTTTTGPTFDPASVPFDIDIGPTIGAETATVTAINRTASPQTFTLTRADPLDHTPGESVTVADSLTTGL